MPRVLVIHGAGMNMRGKAQIETFGPMTLPEYDQHIRQYASELKDISNPARRGRVSEIAPASRGVVTGFGVFGYWVALRGIQNLLVAR